MEIDAIVFQLQRIADALEESNDMIKDFKGDHHDN